MVKSRSDNPVAAGAAPMKVIVSLLLPIAGHEGAPDNDGAAAPIARARPQCRGSGGYLRALSFPNLSASR